jgi:PAS domain S-box-containing protein
LEYAKQNQPTTVNATDIGSLNKRELIHVLHVDDDPSFLIVSKQILTMEGSFEIDEATCVDEALKKMSITQYDIIISDYEMPQKNGLQFLKELREEKNHIPFILFTGKGREEVVIEALNSGADHYVNKQGSPETVYSELAYLVFSAVEKSRAKRKSENDSLAFQNVHDAIVSSDANFMITAWNKSAEELFGYEKIEVLNKSIIDVFERIQVTPTFSELISQLKTVGQFQGEVIYQNKKGQLRNGELYIVSILSESSNFLGNVAVCNDITERKRNEESLKESEEKFRNLAEESPNMIFINKNGQIVYANKKCEELIGYKREEFYSPDFNFMSLIASESIQVLKTAYSSHMNGKEVPQYEYTLISKNGERIESQINSKLIHYKGGRAILGVVTDLTDRKKAEEDLRLSEQKLELHFEQTSLAVIEWDLDFKVTKWNPAATRIFGFSKEDAVGQQANFILPESVRGLVNGLWSALLAQKGGTRSVNENITKDGNRITCVWFNTPLVDSAGKTVGVASLIEDITERMKIKTSIERERDAIESVTKSINAGFALISKDYRITWANDFIRRYKGDVEGKLCYATLNTLDAPCSDCGVTKIYAGQAEVDSHEYCSTTIDGKPYWVEIIATPIRDKDGTITGASELVVDITEKKQREKELKESSRKIELMNEKLRVVGGLTRHDARNKLSAVNGYSYLMKKKHKDLADVVDGLDKIDKSVKEVERIFEFARAYEKLGSEELSFVDVGKALDEAKALFSIPLPNVINDCQGLMLLSDSFMRQMLYNFIDNTTKYGKKTTAIKLYYEKTSEGQLRLIYEDDGEGICVDDKSKLFKEGYSTGGSTGYGLFLTKKMMDVYGWAIEETGGQGKGARFVITIPKLNNSGKENYRIADS